MPAPLPHPTETRHTQPPSTTPNRATTAPQPPAIALIPTSIAFAARAPSNPALSPCAPLRAGTPVGGPVGYGADLGHLPAPAYPLQGAGPPSAPSARRPPPRTRVPDIAGATRSAMAEVAAAGGGITAPATGTEEPILVTFNQVEEPILVTFNQVAAAAPRRERSGGGGSSAAGSDATAGSGAAPRRRRKKKHGTSRSGGSSVCSSEGESENEDGAPSRWTRPASAPTRAEDLDESSEEIRRFDTVAHAAAMEAAMAAEAAHAAEVKRRVSFGETLVSPTRDPGAGDDDGLDPVKIQKQLKAQRKLIAKQANQISSLIDREITRAAVVASSPGGASRSVGFETAAPPAAPQPSRTTSSTLPPSTAPRSVGFGPAAGTSSSGGGEAKPNLAGLTASTRAAVAFSGGGLAGGNPAGGADGAAARPARSAALERATRAREATPPRRPDGTPRDQPPAAAREMPQWEHSGSAQLVAVAESSHAERRSGGGGSSRAGGSAAGSAAGDKPRRKRRTGASSVASSQYAEMTI